MFLAYLMQSQGCDYTIGCGSLVIELESYKFDEAKNELIGIIKTNFSSDARRLNKAELLEVKNSMELDVDDIYKELEKEKEEFQKSEKEKSEKLEYERLKNKFEGR